MKNTKRAMKQNNIRYFSSLTAIEKDKSTNYVKMIIEGVDGLEWGFAMAVLKNTEFKNVKLIGCKMFMYEPSNVWIPLNIKSILNDFKK